MRMTSLLLAAALLALATRAARAADWSGFIDNQGQVDARVRYYAIGNGVTAYVTDDALVLDLAGAATLQPEPDQAMRRRRCAARLSFARANAAPRLEARTPTPVRRHFFLGNDPARWRTDVREYQEIVYHDVWPGASLVLRASGDELRFGLLLDAGVDAARARLTCEGARLTTLANGSLCVATELRAIVLQRDDSSAPRPDPIETFTEPSLLAWSTFLGGSSDEMAWGTAIDSHGNVLVTGLTLSSHFPSTPGAYDETYNGFGDVFVSKLDADGRQLLWSTLIGGSASNFDYGYALALDASDQPVITGYTWSSDFPTTAGAFDRKHHGQTDAFVSKLGANGDQLLWSTFLGASDQDIGYAVALDAAGNPVVAGRTLSFDFPTTSGAFDRSQNGEEDGFVAKLDASGSTLAWSTFVGGGVFDTCRGVTLASNDDALVVGYTASLDFPITPGAFSTTYNGGLYDVFALRLTAAGSALAWSTYLGGEDYEYGIGIARDAQDDVVITGATASTGFPVTGGAFDTTHDGFDDVYVTKLDGQSSTVQWSTFVGGSTFGYETGFDVAIDAAGEVLVVGSTPSPDFPVTADAFQHELAGDVDAFLIELSQNGSQLDWSTFLGGPLTDNAWAIALDRRGHPVIAGSTGSRRFPTTRNAYDRTYDGGDQDVFVSKFGGPLLRR